MSSVSHYAHKSSHNWQPPLEHASAVALEFPHAELRAVEGGLSRTVSHSGIAELSPALFDSVPMRVKRVFDIIGALTLGLLALPLVALVALAVKLDSRGTVFYGHTRVGKGGRSFRAWKFRSMVTNSDEVLKSYLQRNPLANAEWKAKHKLRHDPRITRVGRFLRKSSLDELPQFWNVLVGEMSLVGPRPIIHEERVHYREAIALYDSVVPGLSGLWQVSGRSDTTYEERVLLDTHYIFNWSLWLDLKILLRTMPALLSRRGAC
jgi:Undecaprenyl-phosphate galactose phosphotransferase WbaP